MKESETVDIPKEDLKYVCKEFRISKKFASVLSIVSIIGFFGIISQTLFGFDADIYVQALWFLIMGLGFIFEARPILLLRKLDDSLNHRNFTSLTTLVVGVMAFVCGVLTFIGIDGIVFAAIQGLISIIAVIFIAIQSWIIK